MRSLCLLVSICYACSAFCEQVRIGGPQSEFDASHSYYQGLIELAFAKINQPLEIIYTPLMVQNRALKEMEMHGLMDVYWAGTNAQREARYGHVAIPLVKGLLGFRVFVLHQNKVGLFDQIDSLAGLRKVTLCQGAHWPDTDIMRAAGLMVTENTVYENMFKQVCSNRCDAFPRGINEALVEVQARKQVMPNLRLYDSLILRYPFSMYFFTQKENKQLVAKLTRGLELAIDDGSFDRYLREHPTTKHLFPIDRWINNKRVDIPNPFLSAKTDPSNKRYWLIPSSFQQ